MPDDPLDSLSDLFVAPKTSAPVDRVHAAASRIGVAPDIADDYLNLTGKVESGNRQTDKSGNTLTGPPTRTGSRARGMGQVMPDRPGGMTRTIQGKTYNLADADQNAEAGLRLFNAGGSDPVGRRLEYFGGAGARHKYERTGRIPSGGDGYTTFNQYVSKSMPQGAPRRRPQSDPLSSISDLMTDIPEQAPSELSATAAQMNPTAYQPPQALETPTAPNTAQPVAVQRQVSAEDREWHAAVTPDEYGKLTRRQKRKLDAVTAQQIAEDDRKRTAGQSEFTKDVGYQNAVRRAVGLPHVGIDPGFAFNAGRAPIEIKPHPFTFQEQSADRIKASIQQQVADESAAAQKNWAAHPQGGGMPPGFDVQAETERRFAEYQRLKARDTMLTQRGPAFENRHQSRVERATADVNDFIAKYVPGLGSIDTPGGVKSDPIRGLLSGMSLGATDILLPKREISSEEKLMNPNAEGDADVAYGLGNVTGQLAPLMLTGAAIAPLKLAPAVHTAALFGITSAGRQGINLLEGRPADVSEPLWSATTGLIMGQLAGKSPTMIRQIFAFVAPGVGEDLIRGASPQDAAKHALTNAAFAVTSGGEPREGGVPMEGHLNATEYPNEAPIRLPGPNQEPGGRPIVPETKDTIAAQIEAMQRGARGVVVIPPGAKGPSKLPKGYTVTRAEDGGQIIHAVEHGPQVEQAIKDGTLWQYMGHQNADTEPGPKKFVVARAGRDYMANGRLVKAGTELMSSYVNEGNESAAIEEMNQQFAPYKPYIQVGGEPTAEATVQARTAPDRNLGQALKNSNEIGALIEKPQQNAPDRSQVGDRFKALSNKELETYIENAQSQGAKRLARMEARPKKGTPAEVRQALPRRIERQRGRLDARITEAQAELTRRRGGTDKVSSFDDWIQSESGGVAGGIDPSTLSPTERRELQTRYDEQYYPTPHHSARQRRRLRGEGKGRFVKGIEPVAGIPDINAVAKTSNVPDLPPAPWEQPTGDKLFATQTAEQVQEPTADEAKAAQEPVIPVRPMERQNALRSYLGNKITMARAGAFDIIPQSWKNKWNRVIDVFGGSGLHGWQIGKALGKPVHYNELDPDVHAFQQLASTNEGQEKLRRVWGPIADEIGALQRKHPEGGMSALREVNDWWNATQRRLNRLDATAEEKGTRVLMENTLDTMGNSQSLLDKAGKWKKSINALGEVGSLLDKHRINAQSWESTSNKRAEDLLTETKPGDLVTLDPPYAQTAGYAVGNEHGSTSGAVNFIEKSVTPAVKRGVSIIYTNSAHLAIVEALRKAGLETRIERVQNSLIGDKTAGGAGWRYEVVGWTPDVSPPRGTDPEVLRSLIAQDTKASQRDLSGKTGEELWNTYVRAAKEGEATRPAESAGEISQPTRRGPEKGTIEYGRRAVEYQHQQAIEEAAKILSAAEAPRLRGEPVDRERQIQTVIERANAARLEALNLGVGDAAERATVDKEIPAFTRESLKADIDARAKELGKPVGTVEALPATVEAYRPQEGEHVSWTEGDKTKTGKVEKVMPSGRVKVRVDGKTDTRRVTLGADTEFQPHTKEAKTQARAAGRPRLDPKVDSLERAIRAKGGIEDDGSGELAQLKSFGKPGLVTKDGMSPEEMTQALREDGYGVNTFANEQYGNGIDAAKMIEAATEDARGSRKHYSSQAEQDFTKAEEDHWLSQMEPAEREQWQAAQKFLNSPRVNRLLQEVADGQATTETYRKLRETGKARGLDAETIARIVATKEPDTTSGSGAPGETKPAGEAATGTEGSALTDDFIGPDGQPRFAKNPSGWESAEPGAVHPPAFSVTENRVKLENSEASRLLDAAYRQMGMTPRGDSGIGGVYEANPERLIRQLEKMSDKGAGELAQAVRDAAKAGDGKILMAFGDSAMRHEMFHESSAAANRYLQDRHADLKAFEGDATFEKIRKALTTEMHYPNNLPSIVEEGAAYIAQGEHVRLGLSDAEAADYMDKWFKSFAEKNGAVSLRKFREMSEHAQKALETAYENARAAEASSERPDANVSSVEAGREKGSREPPQVSEGKLTLFARKFGESEADWRKRESIAEPKREEPKTAKTIIPPVTGALSPPTRRATTKETALETTGIARRVEDVRRDRLSTDDVQATGEGTSGRESVERGRALLRAGKSPEQAVKDFEKTGTISADAMALVRAKHEELAKAANKAFDQGRHKLNNPEFQVAEKARQEWWEKSVRPMQTEWHKTGMAQQGETAIDTGTFYGLYRAFKQETGREMTPKEEKNAQRLTERVATSDNQVQDAQKALVAQLDRANNLTDLPSDVQQSIRKFIEQAGQKEARTTTRARARKALDTEAATIKQNLAAAFQKVKSAQGVQPLGLARLDPEGEITKLVLSYAKNRVKAGIIDAAQLIDDVHGMVTQFADVSRQEVTEGLAGMGAAKRKVTQSDWLQVKKNIQGEVKAEGVRQTRAEIRRRAMAGQITPEDGKTIWQYARENYIDKGVEFDAAVQSIAKDLGASPEQIRRAIVNQPKVKRITDELYKQMSARRAARSTAEAWVRDADKSPLMKTLEGSADVFFNIATFGHGTVGMVTHAGENIYHPTRWVNYFKNMGRTYKAAYNSGVHERLMQDLVNRPNYTTARRGGLKNEPGKFYDEYQNNMARRMFGAIGKIGNRGFDVLKVLRQDFFDARWDKLSSEQQTPEMAKAISDLSNHATGAVRASFPSATRIAFFAAPLEASRWARILGDPIRALSTYSKWSKATPSERYFANAVTKNHAGFLATYMASLALNQAVLSATGSDDKINFTDPSKGDWLRHKVKGRAIESTGGIIGTIDFLGKLASTAFGEKRRGETRYVTMGKAAAQYGRGKFSPVAGTATDFITKTDYSGRPLPQMPYLPDYLSFLQPDAGTANKPAYTWAEYGAHHAPIPAAEGLRDFFDTMRQEGVPTNTIRQVISAALAHKRAVAKAAAIGVSSGATGVRIGAEYTSKPRRSTPISMPRRVQASP